MGFRDDRRVDHAATIHRASRTCSRVRHAIVNGTARPQSRGQRLVCSGARKFGHRESLCWSPPQGGHQRGLCFDETVVGGEQLGADELVEGWQPAGSVT
jgi:hypothetical protein